MRPTSELRRHHHSHHSLQPSLFRRRPPPLMAIRRAHRRVELFPFSPSALHHLCAAPDHHLAHYRRATMDSPLQSSSGLVSDVSSTTWARDSSPTPSPEFMISCPAPPQRAAPAATRRHGATTPVSPWPPNHPQLSPLVFGMAESTSTSGSLPPADRIHRPATVHRWKKGSSPTSTHGLKGRNRPDHFLARWAEFL
jgi:hypothetical protein